MLDPDVLNLVQRETTGGKISKHSIDEIASSSLTKLRISGLRQDTFDYLVKTYGSRFKEIDFWKCPRVVDLSQLSALESIESVSLYWNQGTDRLWDMSANKRLKRLSFFDFTKLREIGDLATSKTLEHIHFGNAVWPKMVVESLHPLVGIPTLRKLHFEPKKIADGRVGALTQIKNLRELEFPPKMFSTEKVAWLAARIGSKVQSNVLRAVRTLERPLPYKGRHLDSVVTGKRKPMLDSKADPEKLQRYIDRFDDLKTFFEDNTANGEPD